MNIIYSNHAKKRLKQRGIEEWEIEHAIKFPKYLKKNIDNKKEVVANIKNRTLKIIFSEEENYIKIITLMIE